MKPIIVPTTDVNSERAVLVAWFAASGSLIEQGDLLAEVETSKAVLEVVAPEAGALLHLAAEGTEFSLADPVALLFPDLAALEGHQAHQAQVPAPQAEAPAVHASQKAVQRAAELGVDLSAIVGAGLITVKDVEEAAAKSSTIDESALPSPLTAAADVQRVLLIGGGLGATQVIDILSGSTTQQAVAIVDDSREKWGTLVAGVPVVGGSDRLGQLFADKTFDAAIIAISTSVAARRKLREKCQALGIPLANAIDPTAKIATGVQMGQGNVICAFCHLGTEVRIGDNNFLSAYNSFDHHSTLGTDISTGPSCVSSGLVTIGDRVRLGTGIFIEPHVELGDGVQVASGAVIVRSVPAEHTVKTKLVTTVVVPQRRSA
ncbi:biotin/lipoyl-containing protein [Catellatospora sichuanensis]|uniref:biotin/lipoyl-containing protein n=1 Tax=Catellatospora sichuanensis TaxID=1969805 RepID=UPI00118296F5|nr:biotin/lipoyl-containing protein [Catellatospora sichuanensis]